MKWKLPRSAPGPVLLLLLFVLLVIAYRPASRPTLAPPWALPGGASPEALPQPSPVTVTGEPLQRWQLEITFADGTSPPEEQGVVADELETALRYNVERFGSEPAGTIRVSFVQEPGCNLNGVAYTDERLVQVFTCPDLPYRRAVNILAHEFVHQLAQDYYGPRHLQADMILAEGLATYGAGAYWLGDQPNFAAFVRRHYLSEGPLLPLATSYVGRSTYDMNKLYYQWGSFVEYLLQTYGRNTFDALYVTGSSTPASADYAGVCGKSLDELEQAWLIWVAQE